MPVSYLEGEDSAKLDKTFFPTLFNYLRSWSVLNAPPLLRTPFCTSDWTEQCFRFSWELVMLNIQSLTKISLPVLLWKQCPQHILSGMGWWGCFVAVKKHLCVEYILCFLSPSTFRYLNLAFRCLTPPPPPPPPPPTTTHTHGNTHAYVWPCIHIYSGTYEGYKNALVKVTW